MSLNTPLTITARNVNDAFAQAHGLVSSYQAHQLPYRFITNVNHRNIATLGAVLQATYPVTTLYENPDECVLFHPPRNANPFFHLLEALWMLNGDHDVELPAYLLPRMAEYSDDGAVFYGAYGFRWREWFDVDQVRVAIRLLRDDPYSRRVVVGMWDPHSDLLHEGKDLPCNLMVKFEVDPISGAVNATVFNRSNDVIWGCYGANAVQFSILQQFIAGALQRPVGWLCQFSANWHVYQNTMHLFGPHTIEHTQPYAHTSVGTDRVGSPVRPLPLFHGIAEVMPLTARQAQATDSNGQGFEARWFSQLATFMRFIRVYHVRHPATEVAVASVVEHMQDATVPFLRLVAAPMVDALSHVKAYQRTQDGAYLDTAHSILTHALRDTPHNDWLTAGLRWVWRLAVRHNISLQRTGGTVDA